MKQKWLRFLTKLVKPCHFFRVAKTPKGDYLHCEYDGSYRHKCRTHKCPHFAPTGRYKLAQKLGMVKQKG